MPLEVTAALIVVAALVTAAIIYAVCSSQGTRKRAELASPIRERPKRVGPRDVERIDEYLGQYEVILGQASDLIVHDQTDQTYKGGIAFLIRGPGTCPVSIRDGIWERLPVTSHDEGEELLQEQFDSIVDSIVDDHNPSSPRLVRIPRAMS